jgi:filamentous hemagglutinin family protein
MTNSLSVAPVSSRARALCHGALLVTVSAISLMAAVDATSARSMNGSAPALSAPNFASDAAAVAAQQAGAVARQSQNALNRSVQAMQAMQAAARAAAQARELSTTAPLGIANGLAAGGLVPDSGLARNGVANAVTTWQGANTPTQSVDAAGQTQVGIRQTTANAILNWKSFNVGARTTLNFDQQGHASWVALNRVEAGIAPSQILGNIKADGQVYVINQSGIIFGGASQINVGSLIASTANITDAQFRANGIYSAQNAGSYTPSFTAAGGKVVVEAGALISTAAPTSVTAGGGFVMLLGSEVINAGAITTPKGQALLAAGDNFILRKGFGTDGNTFSTTRGSEVALVITNPGSGAVSNSGVVLSQQGDITLAGRTILQDGVLISTTSVNQRGTIHLLNSASDSSGQITLTGNSVSVILPELDSTDTALDSQRDALIKASGQNLQATGQFDNLSKLADRLDQSRVEIVSGGTVELKNNSLTMAQGGIVAVSASQRIFAETGSTVDVSGVQGVIRPMSANQIKISVQGNELRDSPVNRDSGALINKSVWIDIRDLILVPAEAGVYASDRYYTRGGLLELGGYLSNTAHTIGEWTALGGSITLAAPEVIAQQGAKFDISGGSVSYAGGNIYSSKLIGADGRIYSFDTAPADMKFLGLAGGFSRSHMIQGKVVPELTEYWVSILDRNSSSRYESGYTIGRDAGRLNLSTPTSLFAAEIIATVVTGERQNSARAAGVSDGYKQVQNSAALAGTLAVANYVYSANPANTKLYDVPMATTITVGSDAVVPGSLGLNDAIDPSLNGTVHLDAQALSRFGLGGLWLDAKEKVTIAAPLTLASGGSLQILAPHADIAADVIARGGSVSVSNIGGNGDAGGYRTDLDGNASIVVRAGITIDARGLWSNAMTDPSTLSGLALVNGGNVALRSTGDVTLENRSAIGVSSGGAVLASGKTKGGKGGDVTLMADYGGGGSGVLTLKGGLRGFGVNGGGKLTLSTSGVVVIGDASYDIGSTLAAGSATPADVVLAQALFVAAGASLPVSYDEIISSVVGGVALPFNATIPASGLILAADWVVPAGTQNIWYNFNGSDVEVRAGMIVPGSASLYGSVPSAIRTLPAGYVLPADAFPSGFALDTPVVSTHAAGSIAPVNVTIAAGTLIRAGTILPSDATIKPVAALHVGAELLSSGFSSYSINGESGLIVPGGATVAPVMPVYRFTEASFAAPTGSDPSMLLTPWLSPDLYIADSYKATLTARGGADLELLSGRTADPALGQLAGGGISVGAGASITVDPGRAVHIASGGQVTIDGTITARGGTIHVLNTGNTIPLGTDIGGLSVWIGAQARLDASAQAFTALDSRGHAFGVVPDGGKIVLGSLGGKSTQFANGNLSTESYIVVREGAVIDVSGTSAELAVATAATGTLVNRNVASSGGSIVMDSSTGIYNDGTLLARAGGAGASGGTLTLNLEAPIYSMLPNPPPSSMLAGRALHISQTRQPSLLPSGLQAGASDDALKPGYANLSAEQVAAGGFDSLSLFARTAIVFDGDVTLSAGRSIALRTSNLYNSVEGGRATVSAPYVTLDGQSTLRAGADMVLASILPAWPTTGTLRVEGGLIDVVNSMNAQLARLTLDSRSDLRFLAATAQTTGAANDATTVLAARGDLDLIARRIYPASGATAQLYAGTTINSSGAPVLDPYAANSGTINVGRRDDQSVAAPYSVFGVLNMRAGTIRQGGNLLAPLGTIGLTAQTPSSAALQTSADQGLVEFLPGSLTSVSAKGLVMPYGGTVDGVNFTVNGVAPLTYNLLTGTIVSASTRPRLGVTVTASRVVGDAGSTLDLSGGGTLAGAAFVSGRGGSVDALITALANANPGNSFSAAGNQVYAIMPGVDVAPTAGTYASEWKGAVPGVGEQVTIPAGVPGLPAGTYTLLPANYALLPGAYRVELGAKGTAKYGAALPVASGSYLVSGIRGVAGTAIVDTLSTSMIVTSGAATRSYSQYNEQGYETFQLAQASTFGTLRAPMTVDGKFLTLNLAPLAAGSAPRVESAIVFNGRADFTPENGGYGGTLSITTGGAQYAFRNDLVVTVPGSITMRTDNLITVAGSEIARIGAPSLYLGGAPSATLAANSPLFTVNDGLTRSLVIESGVVLRGSQVILAAGDGGITMKSGASINTLGGGLQAPDSTTGYLFNAPTLLVVSNGSIALDPSRSPTTQIILEDYTSLYSEGSIGFTAGQGVTISDTTRFGTRDLELALPYINIGTTQSLADAATAGILPGGLALDQSTLDRLMRGDPTSGAPGMKNLILSAANSVNFYGSVNLSTLDAGGKSILDSFVLSTPAIYGYGGAQDSVTLTTDRLVWSSKAILTGWNGTQPIFAAAAPGTMIANGPGTGHATFNVAAREIVFGYLANSQPMNTLQFNRLMLGFETVNLNASARITSNNTNSLSVWRTGPNPATPFDPATYVGDAATLNLITPLLTGDNASTMSFIAGGALRLVAPTGATPASTAAVDALGATLNLRSATSSVTLDSAIALSSGKLSVIAQDGIEIGSRARLDLSGRMIPFHDVAKYSWGGDIALESAHGNIAILNGATFDVSAVNNAAGSISLIAPDAAAGTVGFYDVGGGEMVSLDGLFKGSATAGYDSGSLKLSARTIGAFDAAEGGQSQNFARLNRGLNAGGFFGTRDFAIKRGNLTIGSEVKAQHVIVSLNDAAGTLNVAGTIDASGNAPGSIRLSALGNLTVASGGVLDVHSTELQTDSDGVAIDAKNRGSIDLFGRDGVTLQSGATMDLSSPDGVARGAIEISSMRTGETSGDLDIDASAPLNIAGARNISVNAFWTYDLNSPSGIVLQDNGDTAPVATTGANAGAVGLDQIDGRNVAYMNAALANGGLQNRLAGLKNKGAAFHLRPGVEIVNSAGDLTITGDLNLAGYRYGPNADRDSASAGYGAGEVGTLVIRAAGNLAVNGSVSDGFGAPVSVQIGSQSQRETLTAPRTLTTATTISSANLQFVAGTSLNFSVTLTSDNFVKRAAAIPFAFSIRGAVTQTNWVATASIYNATGTQIYSAGQTVTATLPIGTRFAPGTVLPGTGQIGIDAGAVIPAGTNLSTFIGVNRTYVVLAPQVLPAGAIIPTRTLLVALIPIFGKTTPMLAAGSQSWSLRMVSGADLQSADSRTVQSLSTLGTAGNMVLSDLHTDLTGLPLSSVIRTGTGNLDLIAGRDLTQDTPFGVYTAGTQITVGSEYAGVTSKGGYFTEGGGDLGIAAGRNLAGYIYQDNIPQLGQNNYSVGNWLVRQGDATTPAAWGIRFGAYENNVLRSFGGFGTLGGGNLTVDAGSDAGALDAVRQISSTSNQAYASSGLVFAVGSSGRVTSVARTADGVVTGGTLSQSGGGDMAIAIGGRLNPLGVSNGLTPDDLYGSFTNVRGDISVKAAAIGSVPLRYGSGAPNDPRAPNPYAAAVLQTDGGLGGPVVVIGDGTASLATRGDLVLGGTGNPGMIYAEGTTNVASAYSLWRADSAIKLHSAGGNLVPYSMGSNEGLNEYWLSGGNQMARSMLPPIFEAVAARGSLYWTANYRRFELAPSADGYLELMAGNSIYAAAFVVGYSGLNDGGAWIVSGAKTDPNSIPNPFRPGTSNAYFAFQPDTVTTNLHAGDDKTIRVYAMNGDIVNFTLGDSTRETFNGVVQTGYAAAMPARIYAGRDIVNFGKGAYRYGGQEVPSLFLNNDITDVSSIEAGRDILYANVQVGGPGSLQVIAGRNLYLGDKGSVVSVGPLASGDTRPGADLLMQAGAGPAGPNYNALLAYLDPANLAVSGTPLADQAGKVAKTYERELADWLKQRFGFAGGTAEARSTFAALAPEQQQIFLRTVYFAELKAGGREYNDPLSTRYGSYLRGREAIGALFPDANGYRGDITMFGGAGVQTLFGGGIQMLTPGGQQVVGIEGLVPPPTAGIVTQGSGDIQMYAKGSVLLGLSRIMTTFGGNILVWSAEGDINAGRGAKTTVVYTPPKRVYDDYGNVTLAPSAPSTGAGIATLNPIPEVKAGDIDLIAPLGKVDAGEAGIRVSGDINIAALQILNAANIQVQGRSSGIPTVQAPSISAALSASNATAATQQTAAPVQSANNSPSVIIVEVLGYGGGDGTSPAPEEENERRKRRSSSGEQDPRSPVQVIGSGELTEPQRQRMTVTERRNFDAP